MNIKIGELARRADCPAETIRFYEKEGLLPQPVRSDGNYRLYREEHLERLRFIRHCRTLDMALDDVRVLLRHRDTPGEDCARVNALVDEHIEQIEARMNELQQLKQHLTTLRKKCKAVKPTQSCGILQALSDGSCHTETNQEITV